MPWLSIEKTQHYDITFLYIPEGLYLYIINIRRRKELLKHYTRRSGLNGFGSSGLSTIIVSVVNIIPATEAAFSISSLTTLTGSITPILIISPYLFLRTSSP